MFQCANIFNKKIYGREKKKELRGKRVYIKQIGENGGGPGKADFKERRNTVGRRRRIFRHEAEAATSPLREYIISEPFYLLQ